MKRIGSIFYLLLLVISRSYSSCIDWTSYSTNDGLASSFVNAIAIDDYGNIWVGTREGACKFNGTDWTTYTTANTAHIESIDSQGDFWGSDTTYTDALASNYINTIIRDCEGNMWFGTGEGISKFDGHTWFSYEKEDSVFENSWNEATVDAIGFDSKGNVWAGGRGVSVLRNGKMGMVQRNSRKAC